MFDQILGMTALEFWCFSCISFTFVAFLSYVVILVKIRIPQKIGGVDKEDAFEKINIKPRLAKVEVFLFFCSLSSFVIYNICFWTLIVG